MLGDDNPIRPMSERRFKFISVDSINVPNPRKRCAKQFKEIERSIEVNGLQKPIMVNRRNVESTGKYELIFGQGRWEIHKNLGIESILAEVVDEDEGTAYILSLVENIARSRPRPIEFAKAIIKMHDSGVTIATLTKITGRSKCNLQDYITLMKKGEQSLIKSVEKGTIPISFAIRVARSDDIATQSVLMEAFEDGIITESNLQSVRKMLANRKRDPVNSRCKNLDDFATSIQDASSQIHTESEYVKLKETRLRRLLYLIGEVKKDPEFIRIAKEQGVSLKLKIKKDYSRPIHETIPSNSSNNKENNHERQ